jgi:amino-acid N-acetyltransferase
MSADLPAGVSFRVATAADAERVQALLGAPGVQALGAGPGIAAFVVADSPAGPIATIAMEILGGDALIRSVCVHAEWRAQGVGTALVEHVLTEAAMEAVDSVYVLASSADRFFARFGFVRITWSDMPFTITRALSERGAAVPGATAMQLLLADP